MAPDAIVILAGSVKKVGDRWVSTGLTKEDDVYGVPGQEIRVRAAVALAQKFADAFVVPSGGIGYDHRDPAQPTLAGVMRDELVAAGVNEARIVLEDRSNSTFQQLEAVCDIAKVRGWGTITIVTNRWHMPRVVAMLEAKFPAMVQHVRVVEAESILLADSDVWKPIIEAAYTSEYLTKRIASEEAGIRQIKDGSYNFR